MSEAWIEKLAALVALLTVAVATGAVVALSRWLVWWPTLLLQLPFRFGLVFRRMLAVLLIAALVPLLILPTGIDVAVMILLWLTVVPGLTEHWARRTAWKLDSDKDRADAAAIRRSIMARRGDDRELEVSYPWRDYIVDVARLHRRRRYNPPGH